MSSRTQKKRTKLQNCLEMQKLHVAKESSNGIYPLVRGLHNPVDSMRKLQQDSTASPPQSNKFSMDHVHNEQSHMLGTTLDQEAEDLINSVMADQNHECLNFMNDLGLVYKPQRMTCNELHQLPMYQYTPEAPVLHPMLCVLCKKELQVGELLRDLPCGHAGHLACTGEWLLFYKTCVICGWSFECPWRVKH